MPVLAATTIYSSSYEGSDSVYLTARNAASASFTGANPTLGQYANSAGPEYFVDRVGLFFDTSSIPSDNALMSATLSIYGSSDQSAVDFNLTIVNGSALSNPRTAADYGNLLAATASGGTLSSSAWVVSAYNDITLNATGLGFITKAGTTKIAVKSSRDISATAPGFDAAGDEYVLFSGTSATSPAKLTISYEAKGNLFVKAANLHYVDYNGVERYILGTAV